MVKITEKDLIKRYQSLETEELIGLFTSGHLTRLAYSVLKEVLKARHVTFPETEHDSYKIDIASYCSLDVTASAKLLQRILSGLRSRVTLSILVSMLIGGIVLGVGHPMWPVLVPALGMWAIIMFKLGNERYVASRFSAVGAVILGGLPALCFGGVIAPVLVGMVFTQDGLHDAEDLFGFPLAFGFLWIGLMITRGAVATFRYSRLLSDREKRRIREHARYFHQIHGNTLMVTTITIAALAIIPIITLLSYAVFLFFTDYNTVSFFEFLDRPVFFSVSVLATFTSSLVMHYARRALARPAKHLTDGDSTPFLFLMRSFVDDHIALPSVTITNRPSLEMRISRAAQILGYSTIAIGKPGEFLPPVGALREYASPGSWQARAQDLIRDAQAVLFVLSDSEGVRWELDTLVRQGQLRKLALIIPPIDIDSLEERWRSFSTFLELSELIPDEELLTKGLVLVIQPRGEARLFTGKKKTDGFYQEALREAFATIEQSQV